MFFSDKQARFGLVFGAQQLSLVQLAETHAGQQLSHVAQGAWDAEQPQQSLQLLLMQAPGVARKVAVAIPDQLCINKLLLFDAACTASHLQQLLSSNLSNYLSLPAAEIAFDYLCLGLHDADLALQAVRLFAARKNDLIQITNLLATAQLQLEVIEPSSHALSRALSRLLLNLPLVLGVISLDNYLTLTIIQEGVPLLAHREPINSTMTITLLNALQDTADWLAQMNPELCLQQVVLIDAILNDEQILQKSATIFACACMYLADLELKMPPSTTLPLPVGDSAFLISYGLALHPFKL